MQVAQTVRLAFGATEGLEYGGDATRVATDPPSRIWSDGGSGDAEGVLWRLSEPSALHLERGRASQRGGAATQVAQTLRLAFTAPEGLERGGGATWGAQTLHLTLGAREGVAMRRGCHTRSADPPSRIWSDGGPGDTEAVVCWECGPSSCEGGDW